MAKFNSQYEKTSFLKELTGEKSAHKLSAFKFLLLFTINKFTKITHLIRFLTDCKASYNVRTGRQSVSILLQEELVKLIASH